VQIQARQDAANVTGLPEGWTVGDLPAGRGEPHQATVTSRPLPAPYESS
jgi:hypothetical protein